MYFNELVLNIGIDDNEEMNFIEKLNSINDNSYEKSQLAWIIDICGFANNNGGAIYLGVRDDDKILIGFTADEIDKQKLLFAKEVSSRIYPNPKYKLTTIPYSINNKTRYILLINVYKSDIRPLTLTINGVPGIYYRRDGYTNGATYEEIRNMIISSKSYDFDKLETNIEFNPDDFIKLYSFYEKINGKPLTKKKLISMGFINNNNKLLNGSLLFKDDYNELSTIQCALYNGINKGDNKIVTIQNYSGNILDTLEFALSFVNARMNITYIKHDISRSEIPAYPKRALTEAIINALAHRDYSISNSQINIDMFKDRLQITSPGSFYNGEILSKTYNLTDIISKRRNDLISNVLVELKLIKAAGSGFDKITEDYKSYDLNHKPYIFSSTNQFSIVLPDLTYDMGVIESPTDIIYTTSDSFIKNKNDNEILRFCFYSNRTALDISKHLNVSNSTYLRKNIIGRLVDEELLIATKNGKEILYRANTNRVKLS